jgi:hypothetical protein
MSATPPVNGNPSVEARLNTSGSNGQFKVAGGGATVLTLKNSGSRGQIEAGAGLDIESSTDLTLTATNGHLAIEATGSLYLAAGGSQIHFRKGAATEILNIDLTSKEASFYDASNTGVIRVTPNATAGATVFIGDNTQGRGKIELQGKTGTGARAAVVALGAEDGATRYLSLWYEPGNSDYALWLTTSEPTSRPTGITGSELKLGSIG